MEYKDFLNQIIDGGIAGAKRDYKRPDQKLLLDGSIVGFEACRDKNPIELADLLETAQRKSHEAKLNQAEDYWYHRGFVLEVEWVCNVVSAMQMNSGPPTIIPPTARGVMRAAEIVGVKEK